MNYRLIQPPFSLKFREMSKPELKEYYRWFFAIRHDRLAELTQAVVATPGYEGWEPNQSDESMLTLGSWFVGHVEGRPRTPLEIDEIESEFGHPMGDLGPELTNRTFSLAFDIGLFLSQILPLKFPELTWEQKLRSKNEYNYGEPVLKYGKYYSINPVGLVVARAYLILKGEAGDSWLYDAIHNIAMRVKTSN